jgi:hypothetical protein
MNLGVKRLSERGIVVSLKRKKRVLCQGEEEVMYLKENDLEAAKKYGGKYNGY